MPKMKTNKSVAKRVRVTRTGKVMRKRPGRRHLLSCKTTKRKRNLRRPALISSALKKRFIRAICT